MAKKQDRGGVIPYYVKDGEVLMMFMKPSDAKYGGDVFQIAKGKIEKDESKKEGSFREAGEELGLFKGNIEKTHKLGKFLGRTTVYLAKIKDPDMFGDPDNETESVKWMTRDEFVKSGRDIHRPVIKAAYRWIAKQEDDINQ